jgi:AraC-like DNA-binding protein
MRPKLLLAEALVCHYAGSVVIDGIAYDLQPGRVLVVPPSKQETWHFVQRPNSYHTCAHFRFDACRFDKYLPIPVLMDLGRAFEGINCEMENAISFFSDEPLRSEVCLWNILFRLQQAKPFGDDAGTFVHPAVAEARRIIEFSLDGVISISELACSCGISHSQLTRLFKKHYGITIVTYIQQRRVSRIEHLLRYSTKSIKQIAIETGISDLQRFNKIVRSDLGLSPRAYRKRHALETHKAIKTDCVKNVG